MLTLKQVIFDVYTKTRSILIPAQKTSQFRSSHLNQVNFYRVNFDPNTEVKSISITIKTSQFCVPPDTKTELISIHTLNQVVFDLHTKASQLWSIHCNQVNSDPPHWNHVYFDHLHNNQVNFDANTKTMSFSGRVTLRVAIPVPDTCSFDTAAKLSVSSSTRRRFYPQRSSGQAVVTGVVPSPRYVPLIFIPHRVQHSHCSSIFVECC